MLSLIFPSYIAWKTGSVTFYGNKEYNKDPYTLAEGTCSCFKAKAYGICYRDWCFKRIVQPRMVAAINTPGMSNTRLCGKCVLMKCKQGKYRGLDWSEFGKLNVCKNLGKTILVQITDSCPEAHSNPSNKKFCNSRLRHFDLSFWAFEKLVEPKYGVFDIDFMFVDCPKNIKEAFGVDHGTCCNMTHTCLFPPKSSNN